MSNDCSNRIEIIGDKEVITKMFELVKSEARDWGKEPSDRLSEEDNKKWLNLDFDFNKVVPYPEKYANMDSEQENSGYQSGGYVWCVENWGSKWNATNAITKFTKQEYLEEVEGFNFSDYDNAACATIEFTTAWEPAFPVTVALSKQFPELTFKHTFEEEGLLGTGYKVWKAGELLSESEGESEE